MRLYDIFIQQKIGVHQASRHILRNERHGIFADRDIILCSGIPTVHSGDREGQYNALGAVYGFDRD